MTCHLVDTNWMWEQIRLMEKMPLTVMWGRIAMRPYTTIRVILGGRTDVPNGTPSPWGQ